MSKSESNGKMTCTEMIESWCARAERSGYKINAEKLNRMLQGAGLITKVRLGENKELKWVPTRAGEQIGIVLDKKKGKSGKTYYSMYYTPEASEAILTRYLAPDYPQRLPGVTPLFVRDRKASDWLELFHQYLNERAQFLCDRWNAADDAEKLHIVDEYRKSRVQETDEAVDSEIYEDELSESFYVASYSEFNAFEYNTLMQVVLNNMARRRNGEVGNISMASIGCGSEMDLAGALYAACFYASGKTRLEYVPVELARWPHRFSEWLAQHTDEEYVVPSVVGLNGVVPQGIKDGNGACDFFDKDDQASVCKHNVILFPKIMSELSDKVKQDLVAGIRNTSFTANEVFVCVSHLNECCLEERRKSVATGNVVLDAFRDAMEGTHDMVLGDSLKMPSWFNRGEWWRLWCNVNNDVTDYPWFSFGPTVASRDKGFTYLHISKVSREFSWLDKDGDGKCFRDLVDEMKDYVNQGHGNSARKTDELKNPRFNCFALRDDGTNMNAGLAFQIVKFVKRK